MDKRIVKTRLLLQQALLDLLREKPLEAIEIQAITERAETARVTFYRHYGTKEELLLDAIENIYIDMQSQFESVSVEHILDFNLAPPSQVLYEFLERDRDLYKKLFTGSVSALVQKRLRQYIVRQVALAFSASPRYTDAPLVLIANHIASCLIGNVMWWLEEDVPYSAEHMARITHWMTIAGALPLIGPDEAFTLPSPDEWRLL